MIEPRFPARSCGESCIIIRWRNKRGRKKEKKKKKGAGYKEEAWSSAIVYHSRARNNILFSSDCAYIAIVNATRKTEEEEGGKSRPIFVLISLFLQFPEILRRMLQACYKFSTCAWFFDKKRRKKKFESNIDSLLIYLFARQEKIEFEFYVLTCKIEEERNNNDFFARGSESKEEMVKFYREARTTDKIPADAANCNYARRSLKRGWEREEHDTRGQTERERLWFTPLNRSVPAIPFVLEFAPPRTTA